MRPKILVTGGGGFLGSNLVRTLLARGERVRVLGRSNYPALSALGVECIRGDVGDPAALEASLAGVGGVFHVAARVGYWGPHAEYRATNVLGTQALLEAARRAGVTRFVYTSTPSVVLGEGPVPVGADESLPYARHTLASYGPTKAEAEAAVLSAAAAGQFHTAALRPHFIFGPGDPQIVPRLVENARRKTIARVGDGSNVVDVTYIDSAVDAHVRLFDALDAAKSPCLGQAYFIGQESPVRLWDFVAEVLEGVGAPPVRKKLSFRAAYALGAALELFHRGLGLNKEPPLTRMAAIVLGTSHAFSHAKAARDFGYQPIIRTTEGLERLFATYRKG